MLSKRKTKKKVKQNKRKGNNNWAYQMIPYEDWKHLQSITDKDYTKGIFKETA